MDCKTCKEMRAPQNVPYIVHESALARSERSAKRLWVVILLLIILLVGSNCAWIWYESQFTDVTTTVEQDNENGFNSYVGNDGDIYNGPTENNNN